MDASQSLNTTENVITAYDAVTVEFDVTFSYTPSQPVKLYPSLVGEGGGVAELFGETSSVLRTVPSQSVKVTVQSIPSMYWAVMVVSAVILD